MQGLMQHWSLTLDKIIVHAGDNCGERAIVSRDSDGEIQVSDYRTALSVARRFSAALARRGIRQGDRVATMMWNDADHFTAWYGTMGMGAVLHTLNPRLHPDQIAWIAGHGGARLLVVENEFRSLVDGIIERLPTIELVVISGLCGSAESTGPVETVAFSEFVQSEGEAGWGAFNEDSAAGLCYTSGTTGKPKGVLYSHRSNFLHTLAINQPNGLAIGANDVVLPVVPMFHANAWGLVFAAPMAGAELVLPGRQLDGESLEALINLRGVTVAVGVPTVWEDMLRHLRLSGRGVPSLRRVVVGGSAVSPAIVRQLTEDYGVDVVHAWGMTEMSPLGTITSAVPRLPHHDQIAHTLRQGGVLFPVEAEVFDAKGLACAHDDASAGSLRVRGPSVVREYYGTDVTCLDENGWFDTGDIAVIDKAGSVRLVDRAKDVIKSGGEWISSIELENLAATHLAVRRAAVIGVADDKWGERPLLIVESQYKGAPTPEELIEHLRPSVPKWWLPSHFGYCEIPLGATGKIDKMALRRIVDSADGPEIIRASGAKGR